MTDELSAEDEAFYEQLQSMVGLTGSPKTARDPVNQSTIRNWCDAMSEANPYFTDAEAATASLHGQVVAPPAALNVWTMPGLFMGHQPGRDTKEPAAITYNALAAAGFRGVVAVNSDQVYTRYLRLGDVLTGTAKLVDVSPQKKTGLGVGHFVTTETEYTDQNGDHVGSLFFRVLKFKPGTGRKKPVDAKRQALIDAGLDPDEVMPEQPRRPRPLPQWNQDQAWHWEGLRQRELRIQRFTDDGTLMHPPANSNPNTHSLEYDYIVASGRATLYSYTVVHYPQVPAFDYPNIVGLVELEEGVRLISNIVGVTPEQLSIGMPLQVEYIDTHDDVTLHQFRPADPPRRTTTLKRGEVQVGDELPIKVIPVTTRLVVSGALATRDFQDVHHDRDAALMKGSKDIFMNILTSTGLTNAWLGDWAGPDALFKKVVIGLGAPNYPGDLMTMSGSVTEVDADGTVTVGYKGVNKLGNHITGTAEILLPKGA
ncbi:MAG: hypothetical protein HKN26_10610 [Acidimicrobiales bacterium]|nr:hypothetical protein [Acidimicrobiales bacterium]